MDIQKLEKILVANKQPNFRLQQILKAVYRDGVSSFSEITVLPKEIRLLLDNELSILSFKLGVIRESQDGKSAKIVFHLRDGKLIESVLMETTPQRWSVCVSSQVGCPMGCRFCATGKMGFKRNLTAEEIADQVLFWKQWTSLKGFKHKNRGAIHNIVYMGMGEPFLNWENVRESLKILTDKKLFGFGSRSVSISTSGIAEGIIKLGTEFPQINLAVSLHFANDSKRSQFMPANQKDDLTVLKKALQKYFQLTNRQVFIEYILLDGINDKLEDADELSSYIRSIEKLQLLHVNLIRYNITGENLSPSSPSKAEAFKRRLVQNRIGATIRKSLGEEIKGACGQLAGNQ